MPEYPDITVYIEALEKRILTKTLQKVSLRSPFLLRTAMPNVQTFTNRQVRALTRMGKRIVIGLGEEGPDTCTHWMVFHLMIGGRLHWYDDPEKSPGRNALILLKFDSGVLYLTESGSKKRASLHLFDRRDLLDGLNPGGLEVLSTDLDAFAKALTASNHTLKRALTDPHILSGIGNAYSDEILHRARLSPFALTQKLTREELEGLFGATVETLRDWVQRLRAHYGERFPEKVTAFRPEMAVHGRYNQPCPVCESPVQRICYATNETNYCPTCQTEGKILADRSLSRLLKKDWPRTLEELENM